MAGNSPAPGQTAAAQPIACPAMVAQPAVLAVLDPGGEVRLLPPDTRLVRADDLVVQRGEGVFETVRVAAGTPFLLADHLARLVTSGERVQVALPSTAAWERLAAEAVAGWQRAGGPADGVLKLVATKGPDGDPGAGVAFAQVFALPDDLDAVRRDGLAAVTLTLGVTATARRDAPWLLGGVKSTSYAVAMAGRRAALGAGAGEAVWVSVDGEVLEGPTSTVAAVIGDRLVSPPPEQVGVLAGTTWAQVARLAPAAGAAVDVRRLRVQELLGADEALACSAVRGVVGLVSLDGQRYGDGRPGPVTRRLADAFESAAQATG